jgi:flagellar biosynthesis protein FlhA
VITAINIIGGLTIGVLMRGEPLGTAIRNYTTYTVGAALSAQIPAFLIAVATGIIISRSATYADLGENIRKQLTQQPKALFITSGTLLFLALLPGFPKLALILLSTGIGISAYLIKKAKAQEELRIKQQQGEKEKELLRKPESIIPLLMPDPLEVEIGYALIPLVDPNSGSDLLDRITALRKKLALELGIIVPPIRIRDNIQLNPYEYVIKVRGTDIAKARIRPDKYLAIKKTPYVKDIKEGELTKEPTFGTPAYWIDPQKQTEVSKSDYTIVDSPTVLITHLSELIKRYANLLLTREDVQVLIDNLRKSYPTVVSELIPNLMTVGEVQKVLQELLQEGISIRDLVTIFEALADWAGKSKDLGFLIDKVRERLARQITKTVKTQDILKVLTISPELEEKILSYVKKTSDGSELLAIPPVMVQKIIKSLTTIISKTKEQPVILCSPKVRRYIKEIISKFFPQIAVISFNEVIDTSVQAIGSLNIEEVVK